MKNSQRYKIGNLSIKSDPLKPQLITADHPPLAHPALVADHAPAFRPGARKRSREAL